jgi:hypothetical protein
MPGGKGSWRRRGGDREDAVEYIREKRTLLIKKVVSAAVDEFVAG